MFVVQNLFFLSHKHSTFVYGTLQNLSCLCSYTLSLGIQKKCLTFDSSRTKNQPNLTLFLVTLSAFLISGVDYLYMKVTEFASCVSAC